ncbi:uncharacterized protein LOC112691642 [Sipha flava]|uniref:Uncharacterized protein LOC112691642 n=1 Tax=Sipha flava TaxID=143950 RepID=A0A2S2Q5W6_9HEMI|nr:uncharacterized protein LOC112691642 [Sipha flava]
MATNDENNDENDEAEELRFLALQSMVRRSMKNKVNTNETDDQDIRLLRAAALKSITHRNNTQNNRLSLKDDKLVKTQLINDKKRSLPECPLGRKKMLISNESKINNSVEHINKKNPGVNNFELKHKPILEPKAESQSNPATVNKGDVKKIVRNGSIQLSNLDSEKFDETMILHITFSSSESDDSSTECDTIKNAKLQNNITHRNINNGVIRPTVPITKIVDNHSKTAHTNPLDDNKSKINSCMEKMCGLMRNCESEIEKRDEQIKILLEAYEKYQTYNESLRSILQSMKNVRDELSIYNSAELNNAEN